MSSFDLVPSSNWAYAFAGLLAVLITVIILTGHSGDPGVATLIGFLGIVITALTTTAIAQRAAEKAATRAANGTVAKLITNGVASDPHAEVEAGGT